MTNEEQKAAKWEKAKRHRRNEALDLASSLKLKVIHGQCKFTKENETRFVEKESGNVIARMSPFATLEEWEVLNAIHQLEAFGRQKERAKLREEALEKLTDEEKEALGL